MKRSNVPTARPEPAEGFRRLNVSSQWTIASLGVLLTGLFLLAVWGTYRIFTARYPGGNDMIPRHVGARALLLEGRSPYDPLVSERGQRMIYDRLADDAGEDKAHFAYPLYVILFYLPTGLFSFGLARAVWMVVLELCLVFVTVGSLRLYDWRPPLWLLAVLVVFGLVWYHGARVVLLGQFAGMSAALIVAGLLAIKHERDALAGIALGLATAKPQMLFLLWPLLFLWSITARRLRLAAWMAAVMAGLLAISWALVPTWVQDWLQQVGAYRAYTDIGSPVHSLAYAVFPALGAAGEWGLNLLLVGGLLYAWFRTRRASSDDWGWHWVVALTLVVTNLVAPRTATTNYVMMVPALLLPLRWAVVNRGRAGQVYGLALLGVLLVGLWWLFLITVEGRIEQLGPYLPLPFGLLLALLAARPKLNGPDSAFPQ